MQTRHRTEPPTDAAQAFTPVGRTGALWMLMATAAALAAIWALEVESRVIRPADRWLYPILLCATALATVGLYLRRLSVAAGLRLLSSCTALYLASSIGLDLLFGRETTLYDVATIAPWMLVAHLMLFATFTPRRALFWSVMLAASLVPPMVHTAGHGQDRQLMMALVINGLVSQSLLVALLYVIARQFVRLAHVDSATSPSRQAVSLGELVDQRRRERRHLLSRAEQADAALREQEREMLAMLRTFPGYMARVDAEGRFTHVNAKLAALHGLTPEVMIGLPVGEVLGDKLWQAVLRRQAHVRTSGQPVTFERRMRLPDGTTRDVLATQYAVPDENGQPSAAFHQVGLDVTEMRQTQRALERSMAQLDALFEALPLPTLLKDGEGRIQRVSRAYCDLIGHRAEDLLGRPVRNFSHPDNWRAQEQTDAAAMATREVQRYSLTRRFDDGSHVDMLVSKAAVFTPGGECIGTVSTLFDVTEINAAARMLREAREAAEGANAAKSAFLATMSHEIRTPMNGVIGMAEVLLHSMLNAEQAHSVATIRDSAHRLLALLDDVLDFSKIEAGRLVLDDAALDVRALVQSTGEMLAAAAAAREIDLRWAVDDGVPSLVMGDDMRLRQVLTNLMSNAIKFSGGLAGRRGEVRVRIGVDGAHDAQQLLLEVRDNGIGMDDATQVRLFQPFVQAEASTTRRFGGTGLGLAITGRLVDMMGGRIALHSRPNEGSTFTIRLPLRWAATADATAAPAAARPASLAPPMPSGASAHAGPAAIRGTILIVEDDPVNCVVVLRQLELLGHRAELAHDGAQALQMWRSGRYDLVLSDLHMPVMDGYALARAIRAEEPPDARTPLLALTANALKGEAVAAQRAGMDEYLTKPIRMHELEAALRRWLPPARAPAVEPAEARDGAPA